MSHVVARMTLSLPSNEQFDMHLVISVSFQDGVNFDLAHAAFLRL